MTAIDSSSIHWKRRIRKRSGDENWRRTQSIPTTKLLVLLILGVLQITSSWIQSSSNHYHFVEGFGRLTTLQQTNRIPCKNNNKDPCSSSSYDFFDAFRRTTNSNTKEAVDRTTTALFFAPSQRINDINKHDENQPLCSSFGNKDALTTRYKYSLLRTILMGKKGGGKGDKQRKKHKKASNSGGSSSFSSSSPSSSSPAAAAPRVSNQINVSIRRQIRYGKINKQLREAAASGSSFRQTKKGNFVKTTGTNSNPIRRTSYRKNLNETTIQEKALERQRRGQNPDWSVVLNTTYADPLVLVDGYNIIHKWARLKKHMNKGDPERARQLLLDDLEGLASLQRWRIECVFDGAGKAGLSAPLGLGPGNKNPNAELTKNPTIAPFGKTGSVRTVFTGKQTEADKYIEARCMAAKNVTLGVTTSSLICATDDALIRIAASNAGALCMSSDRFVLELRAVRKSMQYRVELAMSQVNNKPMRHESQWGTDEDEEWNRGFSIGKKIQSENYQDLPKREVLSETKNGSQLVVLRSGNTEMIVRDNRNKKKLKPPTPPKSTMAENANDQGATTLVNGMPVIRKKKKKKKKKKK